MELSSVIHVNKVQNHESPRGQQSDCAMRGGEARRAHARSPVSLRRYGWTEAFRDHEEIGLSCFDAR